MAQTGGGDAAGAGSFAAAELAISTDAYPEHARVGAFREIIGRGMLRLDIEPLPGQPFHTHATVRPLPGLSVIWSNSSPVRIGRTRQLIADGNDDLIFQWSTGAASGEQRGREFNLQPGDAVLLSCCDPGGATLRSNCDAISLSVPRRALDHLLCDMEGCVARPVRGDPAALKLLRHYLAFLREQAPATSAALQQLAVSHVYDLLALVLGATRDAAENARGRGASAALLCAIKADIGANLMNGDLCIADIACRHRVTPRYVQMLFEREGTTLTRFIREQRLARAYRMLASPHFDGSLVIDIAFACGFSDVSFFNRCFRARYGATPSDIRSARRISEPDGLSSPN
jgi:AraC-like DNA-binding protein